ncbi:MAG: DMT family transporter [Pseudomonadota bacterium]
MTPLRLWVLIAITMTAFAANSVLNRMAVDGQHIDAPSFAVIRVLSGAVALAILVLLSGRRPKLPPPRRLASGASLSLYLLGFSIAYVHLDAGLGALILFGVVQLTMFSAALFAGEVIALRRWLGAAASVLGLLILSWPAGASSSAIGVVSMVLAGFGWAFYSLLGRRAADPLPETAASFLIAVPMVWLPVLLMPVSPDGAFPISQTGYILAIMSGAITSGLGYALWYLVLPKISASTAAMVQLSAPLLAVIGGALLLDEAIGLRIAIAAGLIIGGIAFGLSQRKIGSSGS